MLISVFFPHLLGAFPYKAPLPGFSLRVLKNCN